MSDKQKNFSAKSESIMELFNNEYTYFVPIYQRNYTWNNIEIEQLIYDLKEFQNDLIKDKRSYYLGNIIVKGSDSPDKKNEYIIIDGQQRITTLILIMKSMLMSIDNLEAAPEVKDNFRKIIENCIFYEDSKKEGTKRKTLKVSNPKNEAIINEIFESSGKNKTPRENIYYKNLELIRSLITMNTKKEFENWLWILDNIKIVKVILGKRDNEISVFESINSKGKSLDVFDLVKNYFFLKLEGNKETNNDNRAFIEKKFSEILTILTDHNFAYDKFINKFFSSVLSLEKCESEKLDRNELYKSFKEIYSERLNTIDSAKKSIEKLYEYAKWFKEFSDYKNPRLKTISPKYEYSLFILSETKFDLYLPLYFYLKDALKSDEIDNKEYERIIILLDFHNIVLSFSPKVNKDQRYFMKFLKKLKDNSESISFENLHKFLKGETCGKENNSSLSTKQEFENNFCTRNIYGADKKISKYILIRIENHLQSTVPESANERIEFDKSWSIEHIMSNTKKESYWGGISDIDHTTYKDVIGNLTLLNGKTNSKEGANGYDLKIDRYEKSKLIISNKYLANQWKKWEINTERNTIQERSEKLLETFYKVFGNNLLPIHPIEYDEQPLVEQYGIAAKHFLNKTKKEKLTWVEMIQMVLHYSDSKGLFVDELTQEILAFKEKFPNYTKVVKIESKLTQERLQRNSFDFYSKNYLRALQTDSFMKTNRKWANKKQTDSFSLKNEKWTNKKKITDEWNSYVAEI